MLWVVFVEMTELKVDVRAQWQAACDGDWTKSVEGNIATYRKLKEFVDEAQRNGELTVC